MEQPNGTRRAKIAKWSELKDRHPAYALVAKVYLVVIRHDDNVSVLYGRCLQRGALMSDGSVEGETRTCHPRLVAAESRS